MSDHMLAQTDHPHHRKSTLVGLGAWALSQGRLDLVAIVTLTLQDEGLRHA